MTVSCWPLTAAVAAAVDTAVAAAVGTAVAAAVAAAGKKPAWMQHRPGY